MATIALHETKDLKMVATRLGHANEMLVLRTYGHLLPGVDREAARRLGNAIRLRGRDRARDEDQSENSGRVGR
jgi:integrase